MDAIVPPNPAGTSILDDDVTSDIDTGSSRSRSVPGMELPIVTAREGQVTLTEASLHSHAKAGYTPTLTPNLVSSRF